MSYIVIVNPAILSATGSGMALSGVLTATVLVCSTMSILMGLFARLPFGVAPGMGLRGFSYTVTDTHVLYVADPVTDGAFELWSAPIDGSAPPVRISQALTPNHEVQTDLYVVSDGLRMLYRADVSVEVGTSVYSGMLNERGTYESDVTVTRTGPEEFLIISSAAATERDKDHIRKNLPDGAIAALVDVTPAYAVFGVMGRTLAIYYPP